MSTITNQSPQPAKCLLKKLKGNQIRLCLLLFFVMVMGPAVFAQQPVCTSMSSSGYVACFDRLVTFTVNMNNKSAGQPLTWIIDGDNEVNKADNNRNINSFFVKSGSRTIQTTANAGENSITINTGHFPGYITVKVKFDAFPKSGACSSSIEIAENCGK
jgi:hypothetical protein